MSWNLNSILIFDSVVPLLRTSFNCMLPSWGYRNGFTLIYVMQVFFLLPEEFWKCSLWNFIILAVVVDFIIDLKSFSISGVLVSKSNWIVNIDFVVSNIIGISRFNIKCSSCSIKTSNTSGRYWITTYFITITIQLDNDTLVSRKIMTASWVLNEISKAKLNAWCVHSVFLSINRESLKVKHST